MNNSSLHLPLSAAGVVGVRAAVFSRNNVLYVTEPYFFHSNKTRDELQK